MVSIDFKTRFLETFRDKREEKDILEDASAQNDTIQPLFRPDDIARIHDERSNGAVELPGDF